MPISESNDPFLYFRLKYLKGCFGPKSWFDLHWCLIEKRLYFDDDIEIWSLSIHFSLIGSTSTIWKEYSKLLCSKSLYLLFNIWSKETSSLTFLIDLLRLLKSSCSPLIFLKWINSCLSSSLAFRSALQWKSVRVWKFFENYLFEIFSSPSR